jgi:O-antigen biosynthesis protein
MPPLVSYAQNFEDVLLWRALSTVQNGSYIDIGAQDPNVDSVSLLFYERGWRGINVEPTPHYAQQLRIARPDDVIVQAAVSSKMGSLKFYEFPDTGLSTSDRQIAKMHIKNGFHVNEIVVPAITLDDVFDRKRGDEIHWLKVDVEGSEKSVLKSWMHSPLRPWIVLIESTYPMSQTETHQQWESLILAKGYKFAYYDGLSRFYISHGHDELFKAFSSGPNVFDVMFHGFSLSATTPFCGALHSQIIKLKEDREVERLNAEQSLLLHEQEASAKLLLVKHEATQQIAMQEHNYREQVSVLVREHAERQHQLGEQLLAGQQELRRLGQEQTQREKEHGKEIGNTRHELESLLRVLAKREQEFTAQMLSVQQQTTQQMAALDLSHRERERALLQRQVEQEQLFAKREHEAEQQIEHLRKLAQQLQGWNEDLRHLNHQHKIEIQTMQQASLRLHQSLSESRQSVERMHRSFTWRVTAPLRAMMFFLGGSKDAQITSSARDLSPTVPDDISHSPLVLQTIAEVNSVNSQHRPLDTIMPYPVPQADMRGESVAQLLDLYDVAFVVEVYKSLLGRAPDPDGLAYYLCHLREGDSKAKIVVQIAKSDEAKRRGIAFEGLAQLIASQSKANHWLSGRLARVNRIERQVNRLENLVGGAAQNFTSSKIEIDGRISDIEKSILQMHQLVETSLGRLTQDFEKYSVGINSDIVRIEEFTGQTHQSLSAELSGMAQSVAKLMVEMSSLNARVTNMGALEKASKNSSGGNGLPSQMINSKDYEEAIKPISINRNCAINPKFSIIILQFYKSELTTNCIRSVLRHTRLETVEIMVVDNGSSPEHVENLRAEFGNVITIIEIGINRYFGEGNNIGADRALGEFVVFMNNDIVVTRDWLDKLSTQMKDDADLVGPAFIYPDGRVQECGAYINIEGRAIQQFKGGSAKDMPREPFECDYISAATILLKRETFLKVGGFDLCYEPAYYEDVDLCLKIASYGGKIICVPEVRIFHNENATSSDATLGLRLTNDIVEINRKKFLDRWNMFLFDRVGNPIEKQKVIGAAETPLQLIKSPITCERVKKVLLFSPYPLTPGGGEKYLLTIAQELSKQYQTTLAFEYSYSTSRMRQLESYLNLDLSNVSLMDFSEAKNQEWDISFVLGNSIAPPFPKLSPVSFYICQFPFDREAYMGKPIPNSNEYHYICYSDFVKDHILNSEYIQSANVSVLSPVIQTYPAAAIKEKLIISVGRFFAGGHCKNQLLLIGAFKKLVAHPHFKDWKLVLVGSTRPEHVHRTYYTQCIEASHGLNVEIIPDASFEVLSSIYGKASLYWHGSGLGVDPLANPEQLEHFGITPIEAASAGCHIFVPNAGGPREIAKKAPERFHVYSSVDELVETTIRVCAGEPVENKQFENKLAQFIASFSLVAFGDKLSDLIAVVSEDNTCHDTSVIKPSDHRVRWVGWSYSEHSYRWSCKHESRLEFMWRQEITKPTLINIEFHALGSQRIRIQLNCNKLLETRVSGAIQSLTIDALGLNPGFNSLLFSFPDAHQPGSDDPRVLSMAFRSLSFSHDPTNAVILPNLISDELGEQTVGKDGKKKGAPKLGNTSSLAPPGKDEKHNSHLHPPKRAR